MIRNNKGLEKLGFSLVEVLIGVVILSLAIMTLSASLRQAFHWQRKQDSYENLYITASSLINEIVSSQVNSQLEVENSTAGRLNGIEYNWVCKPVLLDRNFVFSSENPDESSNSGFFKVVLQHCMLTLNGAGKGRQVEFYRTQYCCPLDVEDGP